MRKESPHHVGRDAIGAEGHFQQNQSNKSSAQVQSEVTSARGHRQTTDEAARRFLRLILPEEGPYIAHVKDRMDESTTNSLLRFLNCGRSSRTPMTPVTPSTMLAQVLRSSTRSEGNPSKQT
jgi:hypothetical protein